MDFFILILDEVVKRLMISLKKGYIMCGPVLDNLGGGEGVYNQCNIFTYMLLPLKYWCRGLMLITGMAVGCHNNIY